MWSPTYRPADGSFPSFSQQDIPPMLLRTPLARPVAQPRKVLSLLSNFFGSPISVYNILAS